MATDNFWLMPGNGILSGLLLNPADPLDTYGSTRPNPSIAPEAVRDPWVNQLLSGVDLGFPLNTTQLSYPGSPKGGARQPFAAAPNFESANAPQPGLLANALLPNASLSQLVPPGLFSDFPSQEPSIDARYASSGTLGLNPSPSTALAGQPLPPPPLNPISYQDAKRPWWNPPFGPDAVWDPWRDQFIKGMRGFDRFYRSRGDFGGGPNKDEQDCYRRWETEEKRCYNRDPWWWDGCTKRAEARRDVCLRNGGQPSRYEPPEWSDADEETWFNPNR